MKTDGVIDVLAMFRARVGDSLEVLDAIRDALNGQDKEQILELVNGYIDRAKADLETVSKWSSAQPIRVVEPSEFYEEYFEWIMNNHDGVHKDLYIGLYEEGWRFDDFLAEKHPDCVSG